MKITSTRDPNIEVSFSEAVLNPFSPDGGFYIPSGTFNLKPFFQQTNDLSFVEMVSKVSAIFLAEEFTALECEKIAYEAFSQWSPIFRKLDKKRYCLELFHGPTGCHRDFGYLWLSKVLDCILEKQSKKAFILAIGTEKNNRSVSSAFGKSEKTKTLIFYPKGKVKPIQEQFLHENGGSIYQVEVEGSIKNIERLMLEVYSDKNLTRQASLTIANTVNIARLLAQSFLFLFSFMRLKNKTQDEIYYAIPSGNYGTLTSGLYAWKCGISAKAFFTDATKELFCDESGFCTCTTDNELSKKNTIADPVSPSNLERLQEVFNISPTMMRTLIFPKHVTLQDKKDIINEMYKKYGAFFDSYTASCYAAAVKNKFFTNMEDSNLIVFQKDNPYFDKTFIESACGEIPRKQKFLKPLEKKVKIYYANGTKTDFVSLLETIDKT